MKKSPQEEVIGVIVGVLAIAIIGRRASVTKMIAALSLAAAANSQYGE